jgi:serine/threonine protein kinase
LINRICDQFESAKKSHQLHSIHEFLTSIKLPEIDQELKDSLLNELIALELAYSSNKNLTAQQLIATYPLHTERILAELAETSRYTERWETEFHGSSLKAFSGYEQEDVKVKGYKIHELLGEGGMGSVYRAVQESTGREVAIKFIHQAFLANATNSNVSIQRFQQEATAAARLAHDNVVQVHDVRLDESPPYFTMQIINGPSLGAEIKKGPLLPNLAARYLKQCADAIQCAHDQQIIHRDVKPQNILLDLKSGRAFVSDFGLAKLERDNILETVDGQLLGTPAYMPPEQATSSKQVTFRSDIYSLGATLYHTVTGRPPFQAATYGETLQQIHEAKLVLPTALNPSVPVELESICVKALDPIPENRYESAARLSDDLDNFLNHRPTVAQPPNKIQRLRKWHRRNPALGTAIAGAVALALMLMITVSVAAWIFSNKNVQLQELVDLERASKEKAVESLENAYDAFEPYFQSVDANVGLFQDVPGSQNIRLELLDSLILILEKVVAIEGRSNFDPKFNLMATYERLGDLQLQVGKYDLAIESFNRCEAYHRLIAPEWNDLPESHGIRFERRFRRYLGEAVRDKAIALASIGEHKRANDEFNRSIKILQDDAIAAAEVDHTGQNNVISTLINAKREFARFLINRGRVAEAIPLLVQTKNLKLKLKNEHTLGGDRIHVLKDKTDVAALLIDAYLKAGERDLAAKELSNFQESLAKLNVQLGSDFPNIGDARYRYAQCLNFLAKWKLSDTSLPIKQPPAKILEEAFAILSKLAYRNPLVPKYQNELNRTVRLQEANSSSSQ